MSANLTGRQRRFVEAYLANGFNAAGAYRVAYTTEGWSAERIAEEAKRVLRNPRISPLIDEAKAKAAERTSAVIDQYAITRERVAAELARMAFADSRRYFKWGKDGVAVRDSDELSADEAAAVVEVSQTVTDKGGTIRVKIADKRQALMDLAKLNGWIVERHDHSFGSLDDLTDEQLEALDKSADEALGQRVN